MFLKLINQSTELLEQALDLRSARHVVITSNIANQDTPGYKSKEIDFNKALSDAQRGRSTLKLSKTSAMHISPGTSGSSLSPEITLSPSRGTKRLDGNTVNAEREMTRLAENTFMYQATAQLISKKFASIKSVINEGQ